MWEYFFDFYNSVYYDHGDYEENTFRLYNWGKSAIGKIKALSKKHFYIRIRKGWKSTKKAVET
jgi:hypothetical protein